jgi:hypothetical protein
LKSRFECSFQVFLMIIQWVMWTGQYVSHQSQ